MNKMYILGISLLLVAIFAVTVLPGINTTVQAQGLAYNAEVCVYKNNELVDCSHNVLYDTGAEEIEQYLGNTGGSGDAFDWIQLCNATAGCAQPTAGGGTFNEMNPDCGVNSSSGAYASVGNGNWTISAVFTSTCDNIETNVTRLRNNAGDAFAGNNFSLVTLQTDDQINVTWTIWVT